MSLSPIKITYTNVPISCLEKVLREIEAMKNDHPTLPLQIEIVVSGI